MFVCLCCRAGKLLLLLLLRQAQLFTNLHNS